jgi:Gene product 88
MRSYHAVSPSTPCRTTSRRNAAPRRLLHNGNSKLGRGVHAFSLPRLASCPGASAWCREHCYMDKLETAFPSMIESYRANLHLADERPRELEARIRSELQRRKISTVRVHVDGDFHWAHYVRMWARIAGDHPGVRFFAFTRSWTVKRLRASLEALRAVPNVVVFASCDPTMPPPPANWPVAWIDGDSRGKGPICPEQRGRKDTCSACGLCYSSNLRNIRFLTH